MSEPKSDPEMLEQDTSNEGVATSQPGGEGGATGASGEGGFSSMGTGGELSSSSSDPRPTSDPGAGSVPPVSGVGFEGGTTGSSGDGGFSATGTGGVSSSSASDPPVDFVELDPDDLKFDPDTKSVTLEPDDLNLRVLREAIDKIGGKDLTLGVSTKELLHILDKLQEQAKGVGELGPGPLIFDLNVLRKFLAEPGVDDGA